MVYNIVWATVLLFAFFVFNVFKILNSVFWKFVCLRIGKNSKSLNLIKKCIKIQAEKVKFRAYWLIIFGNIH